MEGIIDARSDTLTKPTEEMRKAMAEAEVGDDVFMEDPTINKLQQLAATMFGKEEALFVPSGTMGNLISVLSHCGRGEEIILGDQSHIYLSEQGGCAALGGVMPRVIEQFDGTLPIQTIKDHIRGSDVHHARTRLVALENSHNFCGGRVLDTHYVDSVADVLRTYSHAHSEYQNSPLRLHMDGARIFNASVALNEPVSKMCKNVDSISVCLSKGLAAPVGSVIVGSSEFITKARRLRKQVGGGMRQAGVIAAAGILSLTTMVDRLSEDHANAKIVESHIKGIECVTLLPVQTNIVIGAIKDEHFSAESRSAPLLVQKLKSKGILIVSLSQKRFRVVIHYHITTKDAHKIGKALCEAFDEMK